MFEQSGKHLNNQTLLCFKNFFLPVGQKLMYKRKFTLNHTKNREGDKQNLQKKVFTFLGVLPKSPTPLTPSFGTIRIFCHFFVPGKQNLIFLSALLFQHQAVGQRSVFATFGDKSSFFATSWRLIPILQYPQVERKKQEEKKLMPKVMVHKVLKRIRSNQGGEGVLLRESFYVKKKYHEQVDVISIV